MESLSTVRYPNGGADVAHIVRSFFRVALAYSLHGGQPKGIVSRYPVTTRKANHPLQ